MKIFDSHCHLDDKGYAGDLDGVVERAQQAGVTAMMAVGIDLPTSQKAVAIAERYPGVHASVGLHPHDAQTGSQALMERLQTLAAHPKVRAWGETGLDFNRMHSPRPDQERWFEHQLVMGAALGLPMIFHERDSEGRFLELLTAHWTPARQGVVHCFSGTAAELERYLALGLYIGITGILTLQSRGRELRRLVRRIPADRLLVETDAPYLAPTPERNKFRRNEPAFVRTVLLKLAEVLEEAPAALAQTVWHNTCRLYGVEEC